MRLAAPVEHDAAAVASPLPASGGLGRVERVAVGGVVALVAALGVLGAVNSFARVARAVEPAFGSLAWTVPLGIDVGIAAFTGLDLVMARLGVRVWWLRLVPWVLVACTIYLNVAGETSLVAAVAHAVLPGLWVIAVEAAGHLLRSWAGIEQRGGEDRRLGRVRWSRWLLAPVSTARLWRRMVLWETRSYREALRREHDRVLARTDLEDRYGRVAWRWRAPRRHRVEYRLGDLAPAQPPPALSAPAATAAMSRTPPSREDSRRRRSTSIDELLPLGRRVAAAVAAEGGVLSRRLLVDRLRSEAGVAVGTQRASELLARLKDEAAASSRTEDGREVVEEMCS